MGSNHKKLDTKETVEVLYQKMGSRWFAFSLVGDDVFVGSISQEELERPSSDTLPSALNDFEENQASDEVTFFNPDETADWSDANSGNGAPTA